MTPAWATRIRREWLHVALYIGSTRLWSSFGGSRSLAVIAGVTLGETLCANHLPRAGAGVGEAAPR